MIKVENIDTWGFEHAARGMRNPMNSWDKSDSHMGIDGYIFETNDLKLMNRLYHAGPEHRKFARQIFVSMDIIAPLYWWSEMDTYKVGTVRNSCSFMHKGVSKPFDITDFSIHDDSELNNSTWETIINALNDLRDVYLKTRDNSVFQQIRCLLPSGYNQRSTITMNYENVFTIINQRSNHKLDEWREFVNILLEELPYVSEISKE